MSLFSCKDTARLLSEAMDHGLPAGRRLAAFIHVLFCGSCSRFRKHLEFLRAAARRLDQAAFQEGIGLPAEARDRILQALKEQGH